MRSYSLQEGLDGEGNTKKCHLHTTVAETFMCKASGTFWYLAGPCSAPHPFLSGPLQACAAFFRSPTKTPQPRHSKDAGVPTNWENKPSSMPLQPSPSTDLAPWLPLLLNPTPNLRGWDQPSCKRSASPLQLHKPSLFFSLSVIVSFQFTFFSVYRHNKYASNPKKRNNPNLTKTKKMCNIHIMGIPDGEQKEKVTKTIFEAMRTQNFHKLMYDTKSHRSRKLREQQAK